MRGKNKSKFYEIKIEDKKVKNILLYLGAFFIPFFIMLRFVCCLENISIWERNLHAS